MSTRRRKPTAERVQSVYEGNAGQDIIKLYTSGQLSKLTPKQFDWLMGATEQEVEDSASGGNAQFANAEQFGASLQDVLAEAVKTQPNYLDRLEKQVKRGEVTAKASAFLTVAKDIINISASSGQIKRSNRQLDRLVKPGMPASPREDASLSTAIREAQKGTLDASRAIEPIRQGLASQYAADQGVARDISGGQAATYGGLSQLSSLRNRRALNGLTPEIDSIRAREQARLDGLIAQRQANRQAGFDNQWKNAYMERQQYNNDLASAGELGATGRENLYSSIAGMVPSLSNLAGYGYTGNRELDDYNHRVTSNLKRGTQWWGSSAMNPNNWARRGAVPPTAPGPGENGRIIPNETYVPAYNTDPSQKYNSY
jgi:hypothetical protein